MSVYTIKNQKNQQFLRKTVLIITTISLLEKNQQIKEKEILKSLLHRHNKYHYFQARFSKLVAQKPQQQPVKVINKEKNDSSNKIKEWNQRLNEFEAKVDNIVKRPVTAGVNKISNKNEKKKIFSPKKIKVNLYPEKKQESKNINLIISSQQQFHDTLFFLKNDKSDDTKFFQKVVYLINR